MILPHTMFPPTSQFVGNIANRYRPIAVITDTAATMVILKVHGDDFAEVVEHVEFTSAFSPGDAA